MGSVAPDTTIASAIGNRGSRTLSEIDCFPLAKSLWDAQRRMWHRRRFNVDGAVGSGGVNHGICNLSKLGGCCPSLSAEFPGISEEPFGARNGKFSNVG